MGGGSSASANIMKFLEENIIISFGVPNKIMTDNCSVFRSIELVTFCSPHSIKLAHSANYYPQGNVFAESTNKNRVRVIRKIAVNNTQAWDSWLKYALWVD